MKSTNHFRIILAFSLSLCCILLPSLPPSASTIGMISGDVSVDGRPLLVKNRDNSANPDQEFFYNATGPYHYISVTYAGVTDQAYAGVNDQGLAIVNADAWNLPETVPGPDDDGAIIDLGLRTCATVEDFQAIMDSTDVTGRTLATMYAVIDAFGNGTIWECASYEHYRFDLDDTTAAPDGYMVRANFAYEGGTYHLGQHRHDTFLAILDSAAVLNIISHDFISMNIQQNIINEEHNPYPLPYAGREYAALPWGFFHTHDAINRDITRSGCVVQCVNPGEDPMLATLWAIVGEPIAVPALPLWVRAGSVPVEFDGPEFSTINQRAQDFTDYLYQRDVASDAIDTWKLIDESGDGLLPFLDSLEAIAAATGDSALALWRVGGIPSPAEVAAFQGSIAAAAFSAMHSWGPPQEPEITITYISPELVEINWEPITLDVFDRPITVSHYDIYVSDEPFYDRNRGDLLQSVGNPPAVLTIAENHKFFQVRCVP
ncbi:hypothetical protein KKA00_02445 [bacterium]|nr:hypothetical protein [bacterium]MBU1651054.1 hypothetical protein [bacterium]MBU1881559.1 hypothetical protein [bacterium]